METQYKRFQKAKEKGWAKLTMITAATATILIIHQDTCNTPKNVENAVTTIPKETVLYMAETVTNATRKGTSPAHVESWENMTQ